MSETLSDITVKLNVDQPSTPVNMGVLAVFTKGETEGAKAYYSLSEVQEDFTQNSDLLAVAQGYFTQKYHGEKLVVITYKDNIATATAAYYSEGWEFATVVGDEAETDVVTLANYLDGQSERFAVVGVPATTEFVTTKLDDFVDKFEGVKRVIAFASGKTEAKALFGVGALIGALGNEQVGSITWKFRQIGGVDVTDLSVTNIKKLHAKNIFTYVTKAGVAQTSEGFTLSGEFVDALHGDDWIKATIETELQKLLSSARKITYDAVGIAQIDATVTTVLNQATANGIVLINEETGSGKFQVRTVSRANTPQADIAQRKYNGLSFSYTRSGAIHSVTVNGQINL